jgi:hypothetical protein
MTPLCSSEPADCATPAWDYAAMVSVGYFTPAAAENSQKIFEIPATKVRAMTP